MSVHQVVVWPLRLLATAGGGLAALAIGLSAWASHGLEAGREQHNVLMACLFCFGHGVAWLALARQAEGRCWQVGLILQAIGIALFCGSLIGNAVLGWPTRLAPAGGMALMAGWILLAAAVWRTPARR